MGWGLLGVKGRLQKLNNEKRKREELKKKWKESSYSAFSTCVDNCLKLCYYKTGHEMSSTQ